MLSFYLTCCLESCASGFLEGKSSFRVVHSAVTMGLIRIYNFTPKAQLDSQIDKIGYLIATGLVGWEKALFSDAWAL